MKIGVLALQGAFIEHVQVLRRIGVEAEAHQPRFLIPQGLDGDRSDARFEEPSSHRPGFKARGREYGRSPGNLGCRALGLDDRRQREPFPVNQDFEELGEAVVHAAAARTASLSAA